MAKPVFIARKEAAASGTVLMANSFVSLLFRADSFLLVSAGGFWLTFFGSGTNDSQPIKPAPTIMIKV
ncbi:MAG TPA: hypothetical protein VK138_12235, partial [Acidiferrobacterales bacterium]|nr:hypothetical protein [Acidiferrobacterales bacterium]